MKRLVTLWFIALAAGGAMAMTKGTKAKSGRVLVVLSGEDKITVNADKAGTREATHETGFFLTELMIPLKALLDHGYEPVFATPAGTYPVMDAVSDNAFWFGGDDEDYRSYRTLCEELGLCGNGRRGTVKTRSFREVLEGGLDGFAGVFFPGGHAPMEDLFKNEELGTLLKHFHAEGKPTALICHAPIALLSALDEPARFGELLERLNELEAAPAENRARAAELQGELAKLGAGWIYRGYRMTSFSTKEERQEEPGGADDVLGGYMKFYPDEALDLAGGKVLVRARKWQSNVVRDRELITGQNPFSDKEFADALIRALAE